MSALLRFGLLGCGGIGEIHAGLIAGLPRLAELTAVADTVESSRNRLGREYGVPALADVRELCARTDVDAISICLPNGMHADAAVIALRAGKHVLIEKPIDITLEAADRIIAAEKESGLTAGVICQRRFQPAFSYLHDIAVNGRLGALTNGSVQTTFWRPQAYYDSGSWRGTWAGEGGGALMNQGSHALDLLLWTMGEPVRVSAYAGTLAHQRIEVEDTIAATVAFANGAIGTFSATTAAYPGLGVRMQLSGIAGSAVVENDELQYLHTLDVEKAAPAAYENDGDETNHVALATEAQGLPSVDVAHSAQYVDFITAVTEGREPLVTTRSGRRVLEVMLAAYESARNNGASVELS